MSNLMEYVLGLKDHKEFDELMRQYYSGTIGEKNSATPTPSPSASDAPAASYDYDKILGIKYKRINASAKYTWDENYKVWSDHSSDKEFMKKLIDGGQELRISAIVKPNSSRGGALRQGIAYTPELTRQIIREAEDSQIVKDQRANPKTDVFTGKTFQELADSSKDRSSGFDMSSLFTVDQNKLSAAFNIDLSKLVPADGSAVQIDPSKLNLGELSKSVPQLQNVDFPAIIRKTLADGAVKDTAGTYLSSQASQILQGFQDYAQNQIAAGGSTDFSTLVSEYFSQPSVIQQINTAVSSDQVVDRQKLMTNLQAALGNDPALESVASQVSTELANQISAQIAAQLGGNLMRGVSAAIGQVLQETMANAMTQMMTQLSQTIGQQISATMSQFATNMSSAFHFDPEAIASAFSSNLDEKSLAALMATMFSTNVPTLETNLRDLGWADLKSPSSISIYPKSFKDKDSVKAVLDKYNADKESAGKTDQVITYTDVMGVLMSSVTKIVNVVSWLLIAFVSISLVVSSIMIAIITYISVLERKKEIGILRSIGASKGNVSAVFNAETFIEGLIAGIIGVGVTYGICGVVNAIAEQGFQVKNIAQLSPLTAVVLVAISVGLTVVAGLIPASRASRQDPVEALRSE